MADVFVQVARGTPEGIVAAIMLGFQKIVYVATDDREVQWMSLPSKYEESMLKLDYQNYISPDVDFPQKGFLALEVVKQLSPYIRNFVFESAGTIMVPPPFGIEIPPLQTFTFLQVTGRVITRTIQGTTTAGPEAPPSEIVADRRPRPRPGTRLPQRRQQMVVPKCSR